MEGRRYPEGGSPPSLSFPTNSNKSSSDLINEKRRNYFIVPNSVSGQLAPNSTARNCFINRQYSKSFQQFMLNYAYTVVTSKVLSGEV
jgi:hypothetical protein